VGQTPGTQEMAELGQWLLTQPAFQKESPYPIFVTDRLSELYPPAKEFAGSGSGLMAFCFSRSPLGLILYFKPEALQTLTWGGDPHALPVVQRPDGPRLSPRESFKAWRETVRNRSLPWKTVEIESILKLRGLIIDMLIARTEQLSARRRLGGRTEELAASQRELVELGRNAGIAEGSIDPVHEMGHLLNSVNVSATIAIDKIRGFRLATLDRLAEMQGGLQDLQTFFTSDPRAAHVPVFLTNLAGLLESDRDAVLRDLDELSLNVEHINAIVTKQQKHAKNFGLTEVPPLAELLEEIRADITERKHAEEAALRLAEIVNSSADAIIGKTLEGVITSWNAGAERVFGYAASEVIGRSVKILFPPALLFEEAETRARTACGESVKHFDTLRVRKDGTLVNVSVVCSPVTDSEGKIIGVAKIARNVTARKQVEQALAASEMRYRRLFESSKDGILILDAESGMVVDVNPSLVELLGFSHRAFLGKKVWELGFFEDLVANESNFAELREKDYIRFEDKPLKTADGRRIDVEFISNVYIVNGEKVIQCNIRDVTERKQLALAIRESEERFRTMANSISQLAWIARVDGSRFWYNQRWYEYTGTTSGQMEGWDWQSVHDPETLPHVLARWKAAIDSGEPFEMEFPLRGADGKFRAFLTRALPLKDAAGRVMQWFGTNTDVETLKQAEEKIHLLNTELEERVVQRTAQLEAANKELEAFSYSVSHDLRAPLRAVDGFSQAVLEDYGPLLPEDGQRCLTTIREGAQRMGALIDDLLTFSRLSRLPITKQPVDANRQVRETLLELKDEQAGRTIEIRVGELPAYNADPALMKQVWVNLLSNALKYSRNRERTLLEIDSIQQNVRTVYFVRDNGTGFDMRYAHKLFGVFQRLHRQEEFAGTGVGLAIVQRIVHRHGGRIWADAAPDRGATFFFTLEPETPS